MAKESVIEQNLTKEEKELIKKVLDEIEDQDKKKEIYKEITSDITGKKNDNHLQGGFLLKQRAFIKVYLIMMAQEEDLYGLEVLDKLLEKFKDIKYVPGSSEVYKCLYHLMDLEVLIRTKKIITGAKRASVQIYKMADTNYAKGYARAYKRLLHIELQRSKKIIEKGLKDIEESLGPLD